MYKSRSNKVVKFYNILEVAIVKIMLIVTLIAWIFTIGPPLLVRKPITALFVQIVPMLCLRPPRRDLSNLLNPFASVLFIIYLYSEVIIHSTAALSYFLSMASIYTIIIMAIFTYVRLFKSKKLDSQDIDEIQKKIEAYKVNKSKGRLLVIFTVVSVFIESIIMEPIAHYLSEIIDMILRIFKPVYSVLPQGSSVDFSYGAYKRLTYKKIILSYFH